MCTYYRTHRTARRACVGLKTCALLMAAWLLAAPPALAQTTQPVEGGDATAHTAANGSSPVTDIQQRNGGLLDVHVRYIEIATMLEMLSYETQTNIVATTSVAGEISANLYGVTLDQALAAILTPHGFVYHRTGETIFVGTPQEMLAFAPPPEVRVFKLHFITAKEAGEAVKAVLGETGEIIESGADEQKSGSGGGSEQKQGAAGLEYLIITAPPPLLDQVALLLQQVDMRPQQVLIEATILRATLNETNQFGIDFAMLGGVDFQNVGSVSNASADLTTGVLPSSRLQETTFNVNTQFSGGVDSGGFSFGIIKDSIALFLRALEDVTDVVVVANPKIVSINKQDGEVVVGRRDGYLTTTVTETAAIQSIEYLQTGTTLEFRPLINEDGTVRLWVHPKDSNGGLTAANLPFEETTEAQADVLLNDGDTLLIGGLFRERTVGSRSQIPALGNVPILGLLFQGRSDTTVREEVIILLTVHVLKDTENEQTAFRGLLDDVERIRVGSRRGLLGTGRERLAQAHFYEAVKKLEQGDREAALLNVRMTLNNQPKHLAALRLKEELLNKAVWDHEGGRMRTFIWNLIEEKPPRDAGGAPPVFGRPDVGAAGPTPAEKKEGE